MIYVLKPLWENYPHIYAAGTAIPVLKLKTGMTVNANKCTCIVKEWLNQNMYLLTVKKTIFIPFTILKSWLN